ncbi:MAG: hypothetical protein WBR26_26485 [Candidatus Acidiferrum sp.]
MNPGQPNPARARVASSLLFLALSCFILPASASSQNVLPYRDPKLRVDQRVADLSSRMTLEEKVAQLESAWENRQFVKDPTTLFVDEQGTFLPDRAAVILKYGLGEFSRPGGKTRANIRSRHLGPRRK